MRARHLEVHVTECVLGADDVGGHHVGRELDSFEVEVEGCGECAHEEGFGEAGHSNQKGVAPGHQTDHHHLNNVLLPDDDLPDFVAEAVVSLAEVVECFGVLRGRRGRRRHRGGQQSQGRGPARKERGSGRAERTRANGAWPSIPLWRCGCPRRFPDGVGRSTRAFSESACRGARVAGCVRSPGPGSRGGRGRGVQV